MTLSSSCKSQTGREVTQVTVWTHVWPEIFKIYPKQDLLFCGKIPIWACFCTKFYFFNSHDFIDLQHNKRIKAILFLEIRYCWILICICMNHIYHLSCKNYPFFTFSLAVYVYTLLLECPLPRKLCTYLSLLYTLNSALNLSNSACSSSS